MELYLEIIITIVIALFVLCFASLLFCGKDQFSGDGIYIINDEIKKHHYHLKFYKFLFAVVFVINRKWRKGLISKYTFWGMCILYFYYILEIICHTIGGLISCKSLMIDIPILYVTLVVLIPAIYIVVTMNIISRITKKKKGI